MSRLLGFSCIVLLVASSLPAADSPAIRDALAALQRRDFAAAEQTLRAELKLRPNDPGALTLLGVALDNQKKFREADDAHRRAAAAAPNSPDVWNNYANHLLGTGDEEGARKLYLRVVVLDPASFNANVQLARIALKEKHGADVVAALARLPAAQRDAPNLAPLRIAGLYLAGDTAQADSLSAHWLSAAKDDLATNFSIGLALAESGRFDKAQDFFTQALALAPADFNVLSNLGVVAWHTGNLDRARELLETARRQQPENVDVLYNLACVEQAATRPEAVLPLLAHAARLAPQRPDIQKMLAVTTGDLGALDDSAKAWDRYLKLQPDDDVARRERGFTAFQMGQFEQGVAELRRFVSRHPEDAVGHFELGAAENKDNPAQALQEFDRALSLQSDFAAAHSARGSLYYQMGKPEAALTDLEAAAAQRPNDAVSLDRLGQTYLALDRAADAVRVLRKAAALAPDDSKTQLHLARALADAGQAAESKVAMDRFRRMGPVVNKAVPGGLVDYLSLTPEQRHADYRSRLERVLREHPEDAASQLAYLRLLLQDGEAPKASEVAARIAAMKPAAAVLADAGSALLQARQYALARRLLEQAVTATPAPESQLDLALTAFYDAGPAEGLRLLDRIPEPVRRGDFYLARAEMLNASGDAPGAQSALEQAFRVSPDDANLYRHASIFLLRARRTEEALRITSEAMQALPRNRQVLLMRAVALDAAGRAEEAISLLEQIQNRWPEWQDAWTAAGIVLGTHGRGQESAAALKTAIALGANSPEIKTYRDAISAGVTGNPPNLVELLSFMPSTDQ